MEQNRTQALLVHLCQLAGSPPHEHGIELISRTTTASGLCVTAVVDTNAYPTKIAVSAAEMDALNLLRDAFRGDWNYVLLPQ
ncbi:MAG: hypothetical protein NVSMB65_15850 [Chloroflexota bacterium]